MARKATAGCGNHTGVGPIGGLLVTEGISTPELTGLAPEPFLPMTLRGLIAGLLAAVGWIAGLLAATGLIAGFLAAMGWIIGLLAAMGWITGFLGATGFIAGFLGATGLIAGL